MNSLTAAAHDILYSEEDGISVSSRLRFATFTSHFQNKNASIEQRRWYYIIIIIMFCVVLYYARGGCFHSKSVYCGLGGVYVTDLTRRTLWYLYLF